MEKIKEIGKLAEKDMAFNENMNRIFTRLILDDYDWMDYTLEAIFPLKSGKLKVLFEYVGVKDSFLKVDGKEYRFPTEILTRYLKQYLERFNTQWEDEYAFYGGDIVVELWNAVIDVCVLDNPDDDE